MPTAAAVTALTVSVKYVTLYRHIIKRNHLEGSHNSIEACKCSGVGSHRREGRPA